MSTGSSRNLGPTFLTSSFSTVCTIATGPGSMRARWKAWHAKEQGKVRSVGFSCHGLGALRTAVSVPWVDVVLVRISYAGINMDGKPSEVEPVIADLYAAGKAIIWHEGSRMRAAHP